MFGKKETEGNTGLFFRKNNSSVSGGLFGNLSSIQEKKETEIDVSKPAKEQESAPKAGGFFGTTTTNTGLFGKSNSGTGLFGKSTESSSGLFGNNSGSSLFGNNQGGQGLFGDAQKKTNDDKKPTGGLFSGLANIGESNGTAGTSLFAGLNTKSSGLFGNSGSGLFGGIANNPSPKNDDEEGENEEGSAENDDESA